MKDVLQALHDRINPLPEDQIELMCSLSTNLCHTQKNLRKEKREADILRKHHLESLLNEAIASNKKKKSNALKHLIQAERNKQCYAAFRQHTKPKLSGGLAYVTTQKNPEDQPTIILDKEELDDTLLNYSQQHFAKAQGSPFTMEPLS